MTLRSVIPMIGATIGAFAIVALFGHAASFFVGSLRSAFDWATENQLIPQDLDPTQKVVICAAVIACVVLSTVLAWVAMKPRDTDPA